MTTMTPPIAHTAASFLPTKISLMTSRMIHADAVVVQAAITVMTNAKA